MPEKENWTSWLTEEERKRQTAEARPVFAWWWLQDAFRSLAASRTLVVEKHKALAHALHLTEHNKAMCVRCREAKARIDAALALTEEEMLKRLEEK